RALAVRARGRRPPRGTGRIAWPDDVLADVALYEGDADAALRHYAAEVEQARRDDDPIRLVWTLYYVAVCRAVLRDPDAGVAAAAEAVRVADATANPTASSMARYAKGLVGKKSDPDRALALFDEAAELAASVQNFWWQGIALMEAAATLSVHARLADPARAADAFGRVLDHWDRVGDRTQQWLNLRYVVRFLVRLGAVHEAVALHAALVAARRPSPFDKGGLGPLAAALGPERFDAALRYGAECTGAAVIALARSGLRKRPAPVEVPAPGPHAVDVRSTPAPFVGRTPEIATLRSQLAEAQAGRGSLAVVGGDAGIGKTRLAEELAAYAGGREVRVVWGRAREDDGAPPFWPWVQVLRRCAEGVRAPEEIDRVRAELETASSDPHRFGLRDELVDARSARFRLFDRVVRVLREAATDRATLVILDDLHRADPPSLALLRFLAPSLPGTHLLVVGTCRTVDVDDDLLTGVLGDAAAEHLTLSGLDAADVGRYVDAVAGTPVPDRVARTLHAETDGNPFFVTELVRLLVAQGSLADTDPRRPGLPPTVRLTIRHRLDRLTPGCAAMLETAAVLGREFSVPILERAAGKAPGMFDDLVDEAARAAVVTSVPDDATRCRFVHALVRETIYESLSAEARCRWHRLAADALALVHGPDGGRHRAELVHHRLSALPDGDPAEAVDAACA
ncbi:MAG: AAA family ATPase, partial [Actinomycetota bacterium]|nr:AAA family ATPase [Actinomycetota bacterium]